MVSYGNFCSCKSLNDPKNFLSNIGKVEMQDIFERCKKIELQRRKQDKNLLIPNDDNKNLKGAKNLQN